MNTLVYLCDISFPFDPNEIYPPSRREEISRCARADAAREKGASFALLRLALLHAFGLKIEDTDLHRLPSGKWACRQCELSLSHSKEGIAIALSPKEVGVDREASEDERFGQRLYEKIATARERERYGLRPQRQAIAALWTRKESLFKVGGGGAFLPARIDTTGRACTSFLYQTAVVSVSEQRENVSVFFAKNDKTIIPADVVWYE